MSYILRRLMRMPSIVECETKVGGGEKEAGAGATVDPGGGKGPSTRAME